jgi:GDP-D-mannose dehydratase
MGVLRLLESLRVIKPDARFYQASTSEMFGQVLTHIIHKLSESGDYRQVWGV